MNLIRRTLARITHRHAWTSHMHPSDDGRLHPCLSHQQCKNCATTRRKK